MTDPSHCATLATISQLSHWKRWKKFKTFCEVGAQGRYLRLMKTSPGLDLHEVEIQVKTESKFLPKWSG